MTSALSRVAASLLTRDQSPPLGPPRPASAGTPDSILRPIAVQTYRYHLRPAGWIGPRVTDGDKLEHTGRELARHGYMNPLRLPSSLGTHYQAVIIRPGHDLIIAGYYAALPPPGRTVFVSPLLRRRCRDDMFRYR